MSWRRLRGYVQPVVRSIQKLCAKRKDADMAIVAEDLPQANDLSAVTTRQNTRKEIINGTVR